MDTNCLLGLAEAYADHEGIAETTAAKRAAGNALVFRRLSDGANITIRRAARIIQWFSDHWPAGLPWPQDIPRPPPSPDSPAALADAERLENLNNGGNYSDSGTLDDRGQLADPKALAESLAPLVNDAFIAAYLDTYYQVVRQYRDGARPAGAGRAGRGGGCPLCASRRCPPGCSARGGPLAGGEVVAAARLEKSARLQRVRNLLGDGREHSTLDIVRGARVCAVNSIVHELRCNGLEIDCRIVIDPADGARTWLYRMLPASSPNSFRRPAGNRRGDA